MLYLYRNIQPNTPANRFYLFTDPAQFMDLLDNSSRLVKSLTLDNYRINANVIKVKIEDTLTEAEADKLTYAVENRDGYFRAYFVNSVFIQSGYAILNCDIDLWASYIYKASVGYYNIERCNKVLTGEKPIYDDIVAVNEEEHAGVVDSNGASNGLATPDYYGYYQEIRRYYLVLVVNYNAKQNLTGSDYIATTCCIAVRLDDLRAKYIEDIPAEPKRSDYETEEAYQNAYNTWYNNLSASQREMYFNLSVIRMAQDFAGGVYGISANLGKNDANVIDAYIVRDFAVSQTGYYCNLKSISLLKSGADLTLQHAILNYSDYSAKLYVRNVDPNKQFYFGKTHGGLKLNRIFTGDYMEVYIRFIVSASNVEVIAYQGTNQEDITEAFKLTITNNVSETTPLRRIANAIIQTNKVSSSVEKGIEKAGAVGGGGALLSGIASMVGSYSIDSKIRGEGDALMTFGGYGIYVNVPFKATYFTSIDDEKVKVGLYGATYSKLRFGPLFNNLDYIIKNESYLGSSNFGTFIKAQLILYNLPKNANEYIYNCFNKGIFIQSLLPTT